MKIELLCKEQDNQTLLKEVIDKIDLASNDIEYSVKEIDSLYICSFESAANNEEVARKLDSLKQRIYASYKKDKLFVITDDVSEYFCQRLYPRIASFERNIRKVIYIAVLKSKDKNLIETCEKLEEQDFGEIYKTLLVDINFMQSARKLIKESNYSQSDLLNELRKLSENSVWHQLFKEKFNYIPSNFLTIKEWRNSVMHSHEISYDDYIEIKKGMERTEQEFKTIMQVLMHATAIDFVEVSTNIFKALSIFKQKAETALETLGLLAFLNFIRSIMPQNNTGKNTEQPHQMSTTDEIKDQLTVLASKIQQESVSSIGDIKTQMADVMAKYETVCVKSLKLNWDD